MREFLTFSWEKAYYRICSSESEKIKHTIIKQRQLLAEYINYFPFFNASLKPVVLKGEAPLIARRMADAAFRAGTGPMAAVAGAIAQTAGEAAIDAGAKEAIIENGGDIYIKSDKKVYVGIYPGINSLPLSMSFCITPDQMPLAVCSSSSKMGHSLSFGDCDLATVVSKDAFLADAAATQVCNCVKQISDIQNTLEMAMKINGITGVLIIKDDKVGLAGNLPDIVKNVDPDLKNKIAFYPGTFSFVF